MRAVVVLLLSFVSLVASADPLQPQKVQGQDGGYPVVVSCQNCSGGTGSTSSGGVFGVDGGYPLKVDQGVGGASAWKVDGSSVTQPVSAIALPLPTGAAQNNTTAAAPNSCRLTDGTSFYAGPTTLQFPLALDGSGNFKVAVQGTVPISGSVTVSGTVAATQSGSWTSTVTQATGTNLHVVVDSAPTTTVTGTVTANAGTNLNTSALALDATLTGGTQRTKVTDGTNNAAVKAASTAAGATDPALVVAVSPNNSVAVTGTFFQATQPVSAASLPLPTGASTAAKQPALGVSGTPSTDVISVQGVSTGTSLPISGTVTATVSGVATASNQTTLGAQTTKLNDGTNTASISAAGAVKVDGSASTQPVSGTVTANIGTTNGLALDATLTGGTQTTRITDGTNTASVKAASTAAIATDKSLVVALSPNTPTPSGTNVIGHVITDSSSTTAVTGNVTVVQPTGTSLHAVLDTTSTTAVTQATAANLNATVVQATAANLNATVVGTVTANAGTNLNTSALALDATATKLNLAQASSTTAQTGPLMQGAVTTAAPAYTTAQTDPLSLTTAGALRTDASATTQPVSGTVTANAGSGTFTVSGTVTANAGTNLNTSTLSTSANQTNGTQQSRVTDGTNVAAVKAASTAPIATDPALVVTISPNSPAITASNPSVGTNTSAIPTSSTQVGWKDGSGNLQAVSAANPLPISGSITATNPSVSATGSAPPASATYVGGSVTTAAPAYTNGQMSGLSLTTAGAARVDGSGVTQPVSAASLPLPSGAATASNQTTIATQTSMLNDGTNTIGTSAHPVRVDPTGSTTQPISGSVTATQATGSNLHVVVDTAPTTAVTQSGTFTVQPGNTANTTPWLASNNDGTNTQAVKGASTAAVAADKAAVVVLSPNSPITIADTAPAAQTLGALNATCAVTLAGNNSAGFIIPTSSTLAGTLIPEVSYDNSNWVATSLVDNITEARALTQVSVSGTQYTKAIVLVGGARFARIRVNPYTSGTAQCSVAATAVDMNRTIVQGPAADGVTLDLTNNKPVVVGFNDANGLVAPANTDVNGNIKVGGAASGSNAAIAGAPVLIGVEVNSGQPAAATTGNQRQVLGALDGAIYTRTGGPVLWHCSLTGVAASLTQCQAAPAAGLSLYITAVFIQTTTGTAGTYAVQAGTGTNCATGTLAVFPASGTANRFTAPINTSGLQQVDFLTPIKLTAANALCLIGTATNTIDIEALGFTAP